MSKSVGRGKRRDAVSRNLMIKRIMARNFPVRKCYQAAKLALLVVLVVTILAMFEQWRGGKKNTKAAFSDPLEAEYERQILEDESRIIPGLGEGGAAAHLIGEEKKLGEESEKKLAINVYLSDRIPYNRTLKDFRNPACKRVVYDAELPSASVILIFHNEPYSVVVRTIWSVVNSARRDQPWYKHANFVDRQTGRVTNTGYPGQDPSSPFVYLKEIILVDDNSTLPELKGKLSHYVRTRLPPDLIRILRLPDRIGLIRARLEGIKVATSDVIIILDAHCEAFPDWLRPLLQRVKEKADAVVTPDIARLIRARLEGAKVAVGDVLVFLDSHTEAVADWLRPLLQRVHVKRDAVPFPAIDVISQENFLFALSFESDEVGGFSFMGHFTWTDVPEREKKRRGSDIAPTWSPTMAGGLFAISRSYFWELGAYDEQMGGWGGENLEMSFRIWQCGGTLETIPCSRVGHVFRSFHPYGMPAHMDTHGINTARMAEVWMDEYAELFYLHRPDLRNNPKIGDITHRKVLREKLKCKSFQWYLDNIYKEKFVPVRDVYGYGRFKNDETSMCLDTLQRETDSAPLGCYPCHAELQATQYFSFSLAGELRDEFNCATVQPARISPNDISTDDSKAVVMTACHGNGREQKWRRLSSGQLQHVQSRLCLHAPRQLGDVLAKPCDHGAREQTWAIDYTEDNNFHASDLRFGAEREQRLNRLRGQRRISRSLLSFAETSAADDARRYREPRNATERRHMHKKPHHKRHGRKRSRAIKKHTKNKFILKLERTLANGTDEHLEVDIHCRHQQLFPNNSFVRDLVTILNDKDVKVINNGRVFERNKVTELGSAKPQRVLNKMDIEKPSAPDRSRVKPSTPDRSRAKPKDIIREGSQKQWIKKHKKIGSLPTSLDTGALPDPDHVDHMELQHGGPDIDLDRVVPLDREVLMDWEKAGSRERKVPFDREGRERKVHLDREGRERKVPLDREGPREREDSRSRNKVVIEDFVEVKGSGMMPPPQEKHLRKRKHRRPPAPPAPPSGSPAPPAPPTAPPVTPSPDTPPPTSPAFSDDEYARDVLQKKLLQKLGQDTGSGPRESHEAFEHSGGGNYNGAHRDAANDEGGNRDAGFGDGGKREGGSMENLLEDSMDRSAGTEDWQIGESRFRRLSLDAPHRRKDNDVTSHSGEKAVHALPQQRAHGEAAPVKVVMKSNLTFNLGDEFFAWKSRAANNLVNEFLGELVIPATHINETQRDTKRQHSAPAPSPSPSPEPSSQYSAEPSDSSSDSSED